MSDLPPAKKDALRRFPSDELLQVLSWLLPKDDYRGARDIARALGFGDSPAAVRKAFHCLENSNTYPARKDGGQWALSLTTWEAKKWSQERRSLVDEQQEALVLLYKLLVTSVWFYVEAAQGKGEAQLFANLAVISNEIARLFEELFRITGNTTLSAA
jgi:hypothetical protein